MSLTISSVNNNGNNISFGMAQFSKKGYALASKHADIYEALSNPNKFQNPEFFKAKPLFFKSPFTKYFLAKTRDGKTGVDEVADTIIKCGATDNSHTNACFIKQLVSTEKYIHSASDDTKSVIGIAANEVFKKNWDNPELSKKDTLRLLEIAKYGMEDRAYISLNGAIHASDVK